ncbi:glycoside hydrolase family protein [Massilia psychrophila]|uniref:glycoside hydrolase family protein n=1 Tax=Massilia psychrophila TaxID=1603353 RepID=UPI003F8BD078
MTTSSPQARAPAFAAAPITPTTTVKLTQAQFDALVSLTYNAGVKGSFHVFDLINAGNFQGAASLIASMTSGHEIRKGMRVKVFYRGLVARRTAESAPFRNTTNAPVRSAAK